MTRCLCWLALAGLLACDRETSSVQASATTTVAVRPAASALESKELSVVPEPRSASPPEAVAVPEAARGPARYRVFGVAAEDVLNVRAAPDHRAMKVQALLPQATEVRTTSRFEARRDELWVEVEVDGALGWVNRAYLTELSETPPCQRADFADLTKELASAVNTRDGRRLAALVSPARALAVRHAWWNPSVRFDAAAASELFTSSISREWGREDTSDHTIAGSFAELFLGGLSRAMAAGARRQCGEVVGQGSAGILKWPEELQGLTPYSFHADDPIGMNWVTWVAGIELVNKKPYLAALIQYRHEW